MPLPDALGRALSVLRCPSCAAPLRAGAGTVTCERGHAFDLARQGYLSLLAGRGVNTGDTPAMVAARVAVLESGIFDSVVGSVVDAVADEPPTDLPTSGRSGSSVVLDVAGGTGHYLATVLERCPDALGICLDASAPALRRAARAHPRAAAIGADAWSPLPVGDATVSRVLSVFGPRDAHELARVLRPDGRIVVASPAPEHLHEIVDTLGIVGVDPRKRERQAATFGGFRRVAHTSVRYPAVVSRALAAAVVGMGPGGAHLDPDAITERCATLPDPVTTTIAVEIALYAH